MKTHHETSIITRLLTGLLFVLGASHIGPQLQAQTWDYTYEGVDLEESPWTLQGAGPKSTDPPHTWIDLGGTVQNSYVQQQGTTEWSPGSSFTVEFALNIRNDGSADFAQSALFSTNTNTTWQLHVSSTEIRIDSGLDPGTAVSVAVGLDTWNTFRFVVDEGSASVYLNNDEDAILSNVSGESVNSDTIWIGDYGSNVVGGLGRWDAIKWNNSEALTPIP